VNGFTIPSIGRLTRPSRAIGKEFGRLRAEIRAPEGRANGLGPCGKKLLSKQRVARCCGSPAILGGPDNSGPARRPVALRPYLSMGLPTFETMHKGIGLGKEVECSFRHE
jgi:hypothetical protein